MTALLLMVLLCAGCAVPLRPALNERFPDYCDLTQPDKTGAGQVRGTFPCRLVHLPDPGPQAP